MRARSAKATALCLAWAGLLAAPGAGAQSRTYPAGANLVNVKAAPYNAAGNGTTDDTNALQQAMDDYIRTGRILYFPNGTYLISRPLYWRNTRSGDAAAFLYLQGESQTGAVIRLQNRAAAFQNAGQPVAMLRTAPASNPDTEQGFRNAIRDLTLHTGTGNPGASGLQFYANNQGIVERVSLVSGDGQGHAGLDLAFAGGNGPLMARNVYVSGFDYGVKCQYGYEMTLEDITVENQNAYGLWQDGGRTALRHFTSTNAVPAIRSREGGGSRNHLVLLDSRLVGTGAASTRAAIEEDGFRSFLYARNVTTSGYATATYSGNASAACPNAPNGLVAEFNSYCGYTKLWPTSPDRALNLPVRDVPAVPWGNPASDWANVVDYGADATGNQDATAAVQAAVDAGKSTVYFPNGGRFRLDGTVLLRGAVQRVLGNECVLAGTTGGFRLVQGNAGDPPVVVFEQFFQAFNSDLFVEQASSSRSLVVNSTLGFTFRGNGLGDVLLSDVTSRLQPNTVGGRIWARQFNLEYASVTNNGARLWIMGMKTEAEDTWITTNNNGYTEVLGCVVYASRGQPPGPMFVNNESNLSLVPVVQLTFTANNYNPWVRETRGGVTRDLQQAPGALLPYSGFDPAAPLAVQLTEFRARRVGPHAAELTWATASEEHNAGFAVEASANGQTFERVAFVAGAPGGNSAAPRAYRYAHDDAANAGLRYYRLRQADLSGTTSLSPVRAVRFAEAANPLALSAAPNPGRAGGDLTLTVQAPAAGRAAVRVRDALGRLRGQAERAAAAGANRWSWQLPALPPGVYWLEATLNGETGRQRLVVE